MAWLPITKNSPMPSHDATVPLLNIASGLSAGDKNGDSTTPILCRISAILNPKIILLYGVVRPLGEIQIVKHKKPEARNEMDPVKILTI